MKNGHSHSHSHSYACQTILDPTQQKACGTTGNDQQSFYFRNPECKRTITCKTCTNKLAEGFKAAELDCLYATVWACQHIARLNPEKIARFPFVKDECAIPNCHKKIGNRVLRSGMVTRSVCDDCANAAQLVSEDATARLELDAEKQITLSHEERATCKAQSQLTPEFFWVARKARKDLEKAEAARVQTAMGLALAQLKSPPAVATTAAASAPAVKPAVSADKPAPARNAEGRRRHRGGKKHRRHHAAERTGAVASKPVPAIAPEPAPTAAPESAPSASEVPDLAIVVTGKVAAA